MALINYRPNEGMIARMSGVICLLALGLLGLYQFHGFLESRWGVDLGMREDKVTAKILSDLVDHADDFALETDGRRNVLMRKSTYLVGIGGTADEQLSFELDEPDQRQKILDDIGMQAWRCASGIDRVLYVGEGPTPLTADDIKTIEGSKDAPTVVEIIGQPGPMTTAELESLIGAELHAPGAATPLEDVGVRQTASFSRLRIKVRDAKIQRLEGLLPAGPQAVSVGQPQDDAEPDPVVLAVAIAEDKPAEIPAMEEGASLADVLLLEPKLGGDFVIEIVHSEEGEFLTVPVRVAADGSVLGKPIYAPTSLKLEEDVSAGGQSIVAEGTPLTGDHLTALEAAQIARVLVDVDRVNLPPADAVDMAPLNDITAEVNAGTLLGADLVALLQDTLGDDGRLRAVNTRERVSVDESLVGRTVTQDRVVARSHELVPYDAESPVDFAFSLRSYWEAIQLFNKQQPEDAGWRQDIQSRELTLRSLREAEVVTVGTETSISDLTDWMVAEEVIAADGKTLLERGEIVDALSAQNLRFELTQDTESSGSFRAWKITRLTTDELFFFKGGPDEPLKFLEFKDNEGNVLIASDEVYTAAEFLAHERIDAIRATVEAEQGKWLRIETPDGGIAQRSFSWFQEAVDKWELGLLLSEAIVIDVPTPVVAAGQVIDAEVLARLQALAPEEQKVVVRGECAEIAVADLVAGAFEVCERPVQVTLPAGEALSKAVCELLTTSGVPQITLAGGSRLYELERARKLMQKGAKLVTMIDYEQGGSLVVARGEPYDRDVHERIKAAGVAKVTISGTPVNKDVSDLEPGDVPASFNGINVYEALEYQESEVGKNTELSQDLLDFLGERRDQEELRYPITVESADGESELVVASSDDWESLQQTVKPVYFMEESVSLSGPLAKTLVPLGATYRITWAGVIVTALFVLMGWFILFLGNHQRLSDLLVDTESEMRKVSWPTRDDLIGSSQVVIFTVVAMAVYMLCADYILDRIVDFILL